MYKLKVSIKNGKVIFRSSYFGKDTDRETCITEFEFDTNENLKPSQIIRFISFLVNYLSYKGIK
jgi:hypothetical protein